MRCRFFGGYHDGRVMIVDEALMTGPGVINLPIPQSSIFPPPANWPLIGDEFHTTEVYRWDSTVNEAGERRMRWQP